MAPGKKNKGQTSPVQPNNDFIDLCAELQEKCPISIPVNLFTNMWENLFDFLINFRAGDPQTKSILKMSKLEKLLDDLNEKIKKITQEILQEEIQKFVKNDPIAAFTSQDEFLNLCLPLRSKCPDKIPILELREIWESVFAFVNSFRPGGKAYSSRELDGSLLEDLNKTLQKNTLLILEKEIKNFDETNIIKTAKESLKQLNINVKIHRVTSSSIVTVCGKVNLKRTALTPSANKDINIINNLSIGHLIFPLDHALGISKNSFNQINSNPDHSKRPFKITGGAMLEIAKRSALCASYKDARDSLVKETPIRVNDVTVRNVTTTVGKVIADKDRKAAQEYINNNPSILEAGSLDSGNNPETPPLPTPTSVKTVYIALSSSSLHVRTAAQNAQTLSTVWLGLVFSSDHVIKTDPRGVRPLLISQKEYIPYLGPFDNFTPLLLYAVHRFNPDKDSAIVILSDGSSWIKEIKDNYFPQARLLIDYDKFFSLVLPLTDNKSQSASEPILTEICKLPHVGAFSSADPLLNLFSSFFPGYYTYKTELLKHFISSHYEGLNYGDALSNNIFIALGDKEKNDIELIHKRLCYKGMRWAEDNGHYILTLAAKRLSYLWDNDVVSAVRQTFG